jgi:hypothetical protein
VTVSGRRVGDQLTSPKATSWLYDDAGRLRRVPGVFSSATYEEDGQTTEIASMNEVTTTFLYDPNREPREIRSARISIPQGFRVLASMGSYGGEDSVAQWKAFFV